MKRKLTFFAIMLATMALPLVAQNNKIRTNPDIAKYKITGTINYRDGKKYLDNAKGEGIHFGRKALRQAKPTDRADLLITFDTVYTYPERDLRNVKLDFWRYDEEIGEWIYDSEVRQGQQDVESTMKTNIMLVIDNSKSLKDDFEDVKKAAKEFVDQLYIESGGRDIFRVGVIGFSTIKFTKIRNIVPLNEANRKQIKAFIDNLEMENGTALYYSLDTALSILENDVRNNIPDTIYRESRIYAFTDGLDQASVDDSRSLETPTKYYEYLRPKMKGQTRKVILNMPGKFVHSTIVTVKGDDMTEKQVRQFDDRAEQICDYVRKLDDISQLKAEFKKLASDLVKSNYVLNCYIPVGASGKVGWTLREPAPKEKLWMGVNLSGAYGGYYYYSSISAHYIRDYDILDISLGLDMAFPITKGFGIGLSANVGLNLAEYVAMMKIGPLAKMTFANKSALLLGAGYMKFGQWWNMTYIDLGYKFKSPWYINASFYPYYPSDGLDGGYGFGFGVGYSIAGGR